MSNIKFTHLCQYFICLVLTILLTGTSDAQDSSLSADRGYVTLFDGSSLQGWKQSGNWKIVDGTLSREAKGGKITYEKYSVPSDFELQFEWKVAEGSNSGVYYRPGQYEYQILDNSRHADGKNPRTSAASLYFCMAPNKDATNPVGQWNKARVVCKGTVIQHWLNNVKVIDFDYTDTKYTFNVELLRARGAELSSRGAKLNLQDHGNPVWYRNIRMRAIPQSEQLDHEPVVPAEIPKDVLEAERLKLQGILERQAKKKASQVKKAAQNK